MKKAKAEGKSVDFEVVQTKLGQIMVVKCPWYDSLADILLAQELVGLELNSAKGWKPDSLAYLTKLPGIRYLKVIGFVEALDAPAFHSLRALEFLSLHSFGKSGIDFSAFPHLVDCFLEWKSGCDSIQCCKNLRRLYVNSFKRPDFELFANLKNLSTLIVGNCPLVDISHVRHFAKMQHLSIYNARRLHEINGLEGLRELKLLEINGCKISSVEPLVANAASLKWFTLNTNGPVKSLLPLRTCKDLRGLLFYESTNVLDGDLSFVEDLPRLSALAFRDRRHYSRKLENCRLNISTPKWRYPEFGTDPIFD